MSKKYNIRWRESDNAELKRTIKNFNAKIERLKKKNPDADFLPDKISMKELKSNIKTRKDFNKEIKSFQRFSQRGAENVVTSSRGAKATAWELNEFSRKQKAVNRERKKELDTINEKEMKSRGKKIGVKRAEMGTIRENSLKPSKKKFKNKSAKEWEKAKKTINKLLDDDQRENQKEKYRENYIKALETAGMSDILIEKVKSVSLDKFLETTYLDTEGNIDFVYSEAERKQKEDALIDTWDKAIEEERNENKGV